MSAIASRLVSTNAPVRLKVIDSGTALGPPRPFRTARRIWQWSVAMSATCRRRRPIVVVAIGRAHHRNRRVRPSTSMEKLKAHRVGVLGGESQRQDCRRAEQEYGFDRAKYSRTSRWPDARRPFIQEVSALLT